MADALYFIPGGGNVLDTEEDDVVLVPGVGNYLEQTPVAAGGAIPLLVAGAMGQTMGSNCNLMTS